MRHRGCLIRPVPGDISTRRPSPSSTSPRCTPTSPRASRPSTSRPPPSSATPSCSCSAATAAATAAPSSPRRRAVARALAEDRAWDASLVRDLHFIDLGDRGGAPLAFTDASPLPDGSLVFLAAAEDSPDTYRDGRLTGVAIGRLAPDRTLAWLTDVPGAPKLEGIHAELHGDTLHLWLVADPDDRSIPAPLYTAALDPPRPAPGDAASPLSRNPAQCTPFFTSDL
jgi:hypothetical protein